MANSSCERARSDRHVPPLAVAVLGTVTGLAAGAVLGLVSGWFLPTLDGPPARNRIVLRLLRSTAHRALDGSLVALRVRGVVTGQVFEFPVQYAVDDDAVVVVPGRPETKRWWRNLLEPAPIEVLLRGRWLLADAVLLRPGDTGYDTALASYRTRWPRMRIPADSPLLRTQVNDQGTEGSTR